MNEVEMMKRGAEHAKAGRQMTPHECQEVDAEIFAEAKAKTVDLPNYHDRVMGQCRIYSKMRGAFNKGWQEAYFEMVSN